MTDTEPLPLFSLTFLILDLVLLVLLTVTELVVAPRHVPLILDVPLPLVCLEVTPEVLLVPGPVPTLDLQPALLPALTHCLHPVVGDSIEVIARVGGPGLLTGLTGAAGIAHLGSQN